MRGPLTYTYSNFTHNPNSARIPLLLARTLSSIVLDVSIMSHLEVGNRQWGPETGHRATGLAVVVNTTVN